VNSKKYILLSSVAMFLLVGCGSSDSVPSDTNATDTAAYSVEMILKEVVEDIGGNVNNKPVEADMLNAIPGVSGAIFGVDYVTGLQEGTYVDRFHPTPEEIQKVIDDVNAMIDSDNDGMPDLAEEGNGTDPYNPDTDGDGAIDGKEMKDTDLDGLIDARESNVTDKDKDGVVDQYDSEDDNPYNDSDRDGFTNKEEFDRGSDPLDTSDPYTVVKTGVSEVLYEGDDAYYQKGVERNMTHIEALDVVVDHATGLMWQDSEEYQVRKSYTHSDAKDYCELSKFAGFTDWRMPTIHEMSTIIDVTGEGKGFMDPAFKHTSTTGSSYWTVQYAGAGKRVAFAVKTSPSRVGVDGLGVNDKQKVRCVRVNHQQ